jgi:hypothetical protein
MDDVSTTRRIHQVALRIRHVHDIGAGGVEDSRATGNRGVEGAWCFEIGLDELQPLAGPRKCCHVTGPGAVADRPAHRVALAQQPLDQPRRHEPRGAGHTDDHRAGASISS